MIKRKGQIVPRRFVESIDKKSSHLVKFGCDVQIIGNKITSLNGDGPVIIVPSKKHVLKKKRQRTVKGFNFRNMHIIGGCTAIFIECDRCVFEEIDIEPIDSRVNLPKFDFDWMKERSSLSSVNLEA